MTKKGKYMRGTICKTINMFLIVFVGVLAWTGLALAQAPSITSISPSSGPTESTVTIAGTNFNATASANTITFGGSVTATPTSASTTQLIATVPTGTQTGGVSVTTSSGTSNSVTFSISAPTISSISPNSAAVGDSVQINGSGFSTTPSKNTVSFTSDRSVSPAPVAPKEPPMTVTGRVAEPVDTDGDGIPDYWEDGNGLDSKNPGDAGDDDNEDGKTNLDDYLVGDDLTVFLRAEDGVPALGTWSIIIALTLMGIVLYRKQRNVAMIIWIGCLTLVFHSQSLADGGGIFDFKGMKFRALENVLVTVEETGQSARTDAEGNFSIADVTAESHHFIVEKSADEKVRTEKTGISSLTNDLGILLIKRFGELEVETGLKESVDPIDIDSENSDSSISTRAVTGTIVSAQASQLTVTVPSSAVSGPVTVSVGGQTSSGVSFVVTGGASVPAMGVVSTLILLTVLGILIGFASRNRIRSEA